MLRFHFGQIETHILLDGFSDEIFDEPIIIGRVHHQLPESGQQIPRYADPYHTFPFC